MLMKNFVWGFIIFLFLTAPIILIFGQHCRIRLKHLQKMAKINVLKRQQYTNAHVFYASYIIEQSVCALFFMRNKAANTALAQLAGGRVIKAAQVLQSSHLWLSLLLLAHSDLPSAYKQINRRGNLPVKNAQYAVFKPQLAHLLFKIPRFLELISTIKRADLPHTVRPYYDHMAAFAYLQDADMLSASKSADGALKAFQRRGYVFEEAQCYLQLAEIYRLSCINDVAQTMIESALKIFVRLKNRLWQAQTIAVKGMLMVYENRFDEAQDCYQKALQLAPTSLLKADILNQYALLQIVQNKLAAAQAKIKQAQQTYNRPQNKIGQAFCFQLLGQIALQKRQFTSAAKYSLQAALFYETLKNHAAQAESLYVAAVACSRQQKYQPAEKYLRQILHINGKYPNSFHSANAYTLLGLIYLQTGDTARAKVLFQQSLHLEQRFERCEGLVTDYANLALIEKLGGDEDAAHHNLQIALEYAQKTEDNDLIKMIEEKINTLA